MASHQIVGEDVGQLRRQVAQVSRKEKRPHPYQGGHHKVATMVAQGRADRKVVEEDWDRSGWGIPITVASGDGELSDYKSDN